MVVTPGTGEPRFPGFNVVDQAHTWDPVTTRVVLRRLHANGPACFFKPGEEPTARALLDRLLAQDDEPRIPVFELIDERLARGEGDGYRYSDMPEDPEAWRASIAHLDADATGRHGRSFGDLNREQQGRLIENVRSCDGAWYELPATRVFSLWIRYACTAFYSHPWAWNEIGFGGPAYPRGYKNLGVNGREPWEVGEQDAARPGPEATPAQAARQRRSDAPDQGGRP